MKKFLALLLCLALICSLAACGAAPAPSEESQPAETTAATEPAKEATIYDGFFAWTSWRDGSVALKTFIKLNENGTYYGFYFEGGMYEAGTFEIVEGDYEYPAEAGADGEFGTGDDVIKTAPSFIVFTTYDGKTMTAALEADSIRDASLGGMSNNAVLMHEPDYAYDAAAEELPITVQVLYADNLAGNSLTLYHNLTFVDYTGEIGAEGTWAKTGDNEFTLTDDMGNVNILTVDGTNGTYCGKDLSSVILDDSAPVVINTFRLDEAEVGLPMTIALRIDCYSDSTCKLIAEIAAVGAELVADEGTYEMADMSAAFNYTFHFAKGGDIEGAPDYASATPEGVAVDVTYVADVEVEFNGALTPLSINAILRGTTGPDKVPTAAAAPVLYASFLQEGAQVGLPMGVTLRLDCYDNGTCVLVMEVAEVDAELIVDQGTYEVDATYNINFTFETAGEVTGTPDYATATETSLQVNVAYVCKTNVEFMGNVVPVAIDALLSGTVTA